MSEKRKSYCTVCWSLNLRKIETGVRNLNLDLVYLNLLKHDQNQSTHLKIAR
jgi:hypothetical protein